jgi:predicted ABC-type ATPase
MEPPSLYLFAGCNGAGKTTFARAYLTQFPTPPRFLNADEIARGLSPLAPHTMAIKAGRLLLHEIDGCLEARRSFALESTLSGQTHRALLQRAKTLGFRIEIHYLWLPSPKLAVRRIAQRVKMGGHHIPESDVIRRYSKSIENFVGFYASMSDTWALWDNKQSPAQLLLHSEQATLDQLHHTLCP